MFNLDRLKMKKILFVLISIVVVSVIGFIIYVNSSYSKDYGIDYPVTEININADSAMIAHGRYLAEGPAHCLHCHVPAVELDKVEQGEEVAMVGGFGLTLPPGTFYAPNITADKAFGIGSLTDGELYRMMRYNVNHKGMACVDFMPFINMCEDDIYAIIAYLRVLEPKAIESKESEYSFMGKALLTFGAIKPGVPDEPIKQSIKKELSIEYGEYLAYAVANCRGCHTPRDMKTGEYTGPDYSGGFQFGPDNLTQSWIYQAPNITPDPKTGAITNWSEEEFLTRMRKGRVHVTSPMPWGAFKNMDEADIRSVYRYLMSLEPVENMVVNVAVPPTE